MSTATAGPRWAVPHRVAANHGVVVEDVPVDGEVWGLLFHRVTGGPAESHQGPLTAQQLTVLRLMAGGLSCSEMGQELHCSADTVKGYCSRIYKLVGARDRANAVAIGMRHGWLV